MVSLCIFGVVKVWYCLIGSLVIVCGHVSHVFVANTLYMAFIYMYVSHVCPYVVFISSYISHTCSWIACMLCPSIMSQLLMRDSSTCNMVCCCHDNPTNDPIGDPGMARLPWGLQKHAILTCLQFLLLCTI